MNKVSALTAVAASLCLFTGCKKNVTTPIDPLISIVDVQINGFTETFVKDSTGYFNLTATKSLVGIRLYGSFIKEQTTMIQDTTLPDNSKGNFTRIKFTAPDTLVEEYRSIVADQPMESFLNSPVAFKSGAAADIASGKPVSMEYSKQAIEEHKAMYSSQIERQYTPVISDMMWSEITRISADKFKAEEVRNRYRLTVQKTTRPLEMGKAIITIKGDTATIAHTSRLYFSVKFTGQVEIIK